jgi:hypothetical protein
MLGNGQNSTQQKIIMNKQRTLAKLTGYSLVLMALIAGFSLGFAYTKFIDPSQLEFAQRNLTENIQLYKFMLLGIVVVLLLEILVAWTIYLYFKNENQTLALLSCIFRIMYVFLFGIATYYLASNLGQLKNNTLIVKNYRMFQTIWSIGLIVFGIHLIMVGVLMKWYKLVPTILWYLTIIAGASYILVNILKTPSLQLAELSNTLNTILALPMALGELGFAIWLIVKGGKRLLEKETLNSIL